jgi:alkylhydroperoxidase family enzyme
VRPESARTAAAIRQQRQSDSSEGSVNDDQRTARIRPLDPGEAGPEMDELFARLGRQRGNIPNMYRTMAYRPEIARTAAAHQAAIFDTGTLDRRLKEMLAVRVSQINACAY